MFGGIYKLMESSNSRNNDADNLISRVRTGSQGKLPDAATATVDVIEVPALCVDGGPLLVTYERYRFRHRKDAYWAWRMTRAVRVIPDKLGPQRELGSAGSG